MSRALVVGAGSIGNRHAEVLEGLGYDVAYVSARQDLQRPSFLDVPSALAEFGPSYVVVANETARHADAVAQLTGSAYRGSVLVEKPLAVPAELIEATGFARVGVGFNLRFHPVLVRLAEVLNETDTYTVESYAGQDLATWRPARALEAQYSGSRVRGGGVLRDLSHELDYLSWLLGECQGLFALGGRVASVTNDSDDAWGIVARYERAPLVTLQLNYLDTQRRRRLVINTSIGTIEADLVAATLRINDQIETFDLDRNSTYRAMHEAMFDDTKHRVATASEGAKTDEIIAMIEQSANDRRWIEQT